MNSRASGPLLTLILLSLPLVAVPAHGAEAPPFLSLDDLEPGAVAQVKTVFAGTDIDEFEVEIVSVIRNTGPDMDMILGRGLGERIAEVGVAQGMSGSPVYVDGRLIGALSSTWPFLKEPLFGITPVEQMAREADWSEANRDAARLSAPGGFRSEATADLAARLGLADLAPAGLGGPSSAQEAPHVEPATGLVAIGAPLVLSGFDPRATRVAADWFEPYGFTVAEGGAGTTTNGTTTSGGAIEPGATLGVRLAGGDVNMTAIGTVTWVDGDRIHGWGHPFFQVGDVEFPLVDGYIHSVMPSSMISFKLGSGGDIIGTCTSDRRSGISGRLGVRPALTTFDLKLSQRGHVRDFHYELVRHPELLGQLVGVTGANSMFVREGGLRPETLAFRQRLVLTDGREATVETMFTGDRTAGQVAELLGAATNILVTNPFERVQIESIEAEITSSPEIQAVFLTEMSLDRERLRPGDPVRGSYTLRDYRGDETRHRFRLDLAEQARPGRYLLLIADGATADRYEAERNPRAFAPRSVDELLHRMDNLRRPDALHFHLYRQSAGVLIDGRPLPDLPASARAILEGGPRVGTVDSLPAEIVHAEPKPLGRFVQGGHTLLFEVEEARP